MRNAIVLLAALSGLLVVGAMTNYTPLAPVKISGGYNSTTAPAGGVDIGDAGEINADGPIHTDDDMTAADMTAGTITATTGFVGEDDPVFLAWDKSTGISITESQISDLQSYLTVETDPLSLKPANIGSTVQGWDAQLDDLAGLAVTDSNVIVGDGTHWVAESGATLRASLGLGTTDTPQFAGLGVGVATPGAKIHADGSVLTDGDEHGFTWWDTPTSPTYGFGLAGDVTTGDCILKAYTAPVWTEQFRWLRHGGVVGSPTSLAIIPRVGNYYAFGDSNTIGGNGATGVDYATPPMLNAEFRYPNILASEFDRTLTLTNYGIGASYTAWKATANYWDRQSHFNQAGQLPYNWTGVITAMNGWNDFEVDVPDAAWLVVMRHAHEACIARYLLDDYGGISINGYTRAAAVGNDTPGWATDGASASDAYTDAVPFWYAGAHTNRYRIVLDNADYVTATLTSKRGAGVFYETNATGGTFTVSVNGAVMGTFNSTYNSTRAYPQVVWIENLPAVAVIRVDNVSGTNQYLAIGWTDLDSSSAKNRVVLYGTTIGNDYSPTAGRDQTKLAELARQTEAAVGAFSSYPVYLANVYGAFKEAVDQEPQDQSHMTPSGHRHVVEAFDHAYKPNACSSPNVVQNGMFGRLEVKGTALFTGANSGVTWWDASTPTKAWSISGDVATGDFSLLMYDGATWTQRFLIDNATGVLTSPGFAGPLTGNVTGNVSGSSGSCTGNAATATNADTVDGSHAAAFQAADADLTTYGGITPSASVQTLLGSASKAAIATNTGVGTGDSPTFTGLNLSNSAKIVSGSDCAYVWWNAAVPTKAAQYGFTASSGDVVISTCDGATWSSPLTIYNATGNAYFTADVSALTFTDRTPFYEGDALAEISRIKGKDGKIDHSTLPAFARKDIKASKPIAGTEDETGRPQMEEVTEPGRDIGAMVSVLTVGEQQLLARCEALEKRCEELEAASKGKGDK